jgi:hypothetical protein
MIGVEGVTPPLYPRNASVWRRYLVPLKVREIKEGCCEKPTTQKSK